MAKVKKLNVVKEVHARDVEAWERKGYVLIEETIEELALEEAELEKLTAEELAAYAKDNGIDIGMATSIEGILKKIRAAQAL